MIGVAVAAFLCVPGVLFSINVLTYLAYPFGFMIVWGYYADSPPGSPPKGKHTAASRLAAFLWVSVLGNWLLMMTILPPPVEILGRGRPMSVRNWLVVGWLLLPGVLVAVLAVMLASRCRTRGRHA